jgi:hypothetical protein
MYLNILSSLQNNSLIVIFVPTYPRAHHAQTFPHFLYFSTSCPLFLQRASTMFSILAFSLQPLAAILSAEALCEGGSFSDGGLDFYPHLCLAVSLPGRRSLWRRRLRYLAAEAGPSPTGWRRRLLFADVS